MNEDAGAPRMLRVWLGLGFAAMVCLGGPTRVVAQTFEKFDETARDQLPASPFVAGAYGFIWLALLGYVLVLARGLRRTQNEIQALKRRMEERGGGGGHSLP